MDLVEFLIFFFSSSFESAFWSGRFKWCLPSGLKCILPERLLALEDQFTSEPSISHPVLLSTHSRNVCIH